MEINLENVRSVHFIGIGGVGVSAIAKLMHILGKEVSGSDISDSPIVKRLSETGIRVSIGHHRDNIPKNADLLIHTIAVREDNPEMVEAHRRSIIVATYPQMLSVISKNMQTIAVSGTHGKTTTTAMLSKIFIDAAFDPTVIVGSLMKDSDSNLVVGKSNYFIVEACEYRRSFLNLYPTILIITNIDADHLDYYKDIEDIKSAFRELALRVPKHGVIVCDMTDPDIASVIENLECTIIDYTTYMDSGLQLKAPGKHNRQNAAACSAISDFLGLDKNKTKKSLEEFNGTWRRFDLRGKTSTGTILYDDYGHHPEEIKATLAGMKEMYPANKRVAFFQPHLFSRTKSLLNEFSRAFNDVDEAHILPIYAAREGFDESINSHMLVEKININGQKAFHVDDFTSATKTIKQFDENTIVIMMGAGNIYLLSELALKEGD